MIFFLSGPPIFDCLRPLWLALQNGVRFGVLICPIHIDFQCPNQAAAATELLEDHIAKSLEEAVKIESDEAAVSDQQSASQQPTESDENKTEAKADEASSEARTSEDRANKFMMDAARLAEELRAEQESAVIIEKERREQEAKTKDLQVQLDDAETNAIKWGRKMVAKLESRCRELEAELDSEQRRCGDAHKNYRKAERMIKEYTFKADEDRKNSEKLQDLIEKLQQQIKTYKKQIEEAEEIASLNLAKFRKAQIDLADTTERADITEQAAAKYRARERSQSMAKEF